MNLSNFFSIGYKMVFLPHISPVFLLRSSAMQLKKVKICNKNPCFASIKKN